MKDNALFEKNFIERTYPSIISDSSMALAEIVANSWDAGATSVGIVIPEIEGERICIEDNGSGMSDQEFRERWMVMAYNRVLHQGEYCLFSDPGHPVLKRLVFGRNGVGRHALFCFDDHYEVETWKDGKCNVYEIAAAEGESAFRIERHSEYARQGHGTKVSVAANKRKPLATEIIETLGYKFMFDPRFEVFVNGEKVEYSQSLEATRRDMVKTESGEMIIEVYAIPDGEKTKAQDGIAFWVNNRLVGNPSWVVGDTRVEDARKKFAIRNIIIVRADYLIDDVKYDWSGFKKTKAVSDTFAKVIDYIRHYWTTYYKEKIVEVRKEVVEANKDAIRSLGIPSIHSLVEFFEDYQDKKPDVDANELEQIVQSLIHVMSNDSGLRMLGKLSAMSEESMADLDKILEEWSVSDIKSVLSVIDYRIKVIEAIRKLCHDSNTDELHVLHPLVTQSRWLFGVEYDNMNYASNRQLATILRDLLGAKSNHDALINWKKRPDLVLADDGTFSATAIEDFDENGMAYISRVLIIELKKGGFMIGRKEMSQVEEYIDGIYFGESLNASPRIKAFVVGDSVAKGMSTHKTFGDYGEAFAYTYDQLTATAEKRLFGLQEKLSEHYNRLDVDSYVWKILQEPEQMKLDI